MQEQLELLKELQGIDQELCAARRQQDRLDTERAGLATERERIGGMVTSLELELDRLNGELRDLERALTLEQDNVGKAEGRLPAIKTQKEYVAVLKEIDTAKKVNKDLQDQAKLKRDEIASLAGEKAEKDADLAAVTLQTEEREQAIVAALQQLTAATASQEERRAQLLGRLPAPLRKRYQMLIERRNGIAIVAARRGSCTGCNMQLPPQLYNNLYTTQEILTCPHCNRLLHLATE